MINTFNIKEEFYYNNNKIKLISGAMHYFRIVPEYWRDRLEKLKLMGCNCVETYIPWNIHQPSEDTFNFDGINNFSQFVKIAQDLNLHVILRPTPFICAEWDFGGLPYWLLKDDSMVIRSTYDKFINLVDKYFSELFKHIVPLQVTHGGPVIMMQVENEYGSFGNDKKYLKAIKDLMIKHGCSVPLFTSDGGWLEALDAGTLLGEGVLPTANFGSKTKVQFDNLKEFMKENKITGPLMCMEFWIGWFNTWGQPLKIRDAEDAANELKDILDVGHVNIYMFHGGTNFGFNNGCNFYSNMEPQITSYDYDAVLTEWGTPTEKYYKFKDAISKYTTIPEFQPSMNIKFINYGEISMSNKVSLFNVLDDISTPIFSEIPVAMEKIDNGYGYILYTSNIGKKRTLNSKLVDCTDRASVYLNNEFVALQDENTLGENIELILDRDSDNTLAILVENCGRINYGAKLRDNIQRKGIKGGVMLDIHFHHGWQHYGLNMNRIESVDFSKPYIENTPAFYEFKFTVDTIGDTFIHLDNFGKGCAFINGFNLGRFNIDGPTHYLYIPGPLLKAGENKIVIFETDGKVSETITLSDKPLFKDFSKYN